MIEDYLEKLRKEYIGITSSAYLMQHGWADLRPQLEAKRTLALPSLFGKSLAFASITLLLFASIVSAAQAAKPGNVLYPVKLLSDKVVANITQKPEITVVKRGQEIIDLSQSSNDQLDEANKQYQKALDESADQANGLGRQEQWQRTLDAQRQKFQNALENSPQSANGLQKAIEQTEKAKGQVQGQKDQQPPGQSNQNNNNGNGQGQSHPQDQNPRNNQHHTQ